MKKEQEIIDFVKEVKKHQRKEKFKKRLNSIGMWINDNKDMILICAPFVFGAVRFCIKSASKNMQRNQEKNLKNLYCYDRSLGHYWKLRRELTNSEWIAIDKRKSNGERLADILDELKVLK